MGRGTEKLDGCCNCEAGNPGLLRLGLYPGLLYPLPEMEFWNGDCPKLLGAVGVNEGFACAGSGAVGTV